MAKSYSDELWEMEMQMNAEKEEHYEPPSSTFQVFPEIGPIYPFERHVDKCYGQQKGNS